MKNASQSSSMKVYYNGEILPLEQVAISPFDRGFLYGDGVFETFRTYGDRPFRLKEHFERLRRSALSIALELPFSYQEMKKAVEEVLHANDKGPWRIRLTISRGQASVAFLPENSKPTIVITLHPLTFDSEWITKGVSVVISNYRVSKRSIVPQDVKSLSSLFHVLPRMEAQEKRALEALVLDEEGLLKEGTYSNCFVVQSGQVLTPPADGTIVAGVTRKTMLEAYCVEERQIREEALIHAEEIFLSFTSAGPVPVTCLDGQRVGKGIPGPVFKKIREAFESRVSDLIRDEA